MKYIKLRSMFLVVLVFVGLKSQAEQELNKIVYPDTKVNFSYIPYKDFEKNPTVKRKLIHDYIESYTKAFITEFLIINNLKENKFDASLILKTASDKINALTDPQIMLLPVGNYSPIRAELSWHASKLYNDANYLSKMANTMKYNAASLENQPSLNVNKVNSQLVELKESLSSNSKADSALLEKVKKIELDIQELKKAFESKDLSVTTKNNSAQPKIESVEKKESNSSVYIISILTIIAVFQFYFLNKKYGAN